MDWKLFLIFLAATFAAGTTGAVFGPGTWYDALAKPTWTPPRWTFPVVWTTLYVLIAYAAARVAPLPGAGTALALFALQIALNTLWTPVFFGAHRMAAGFLIIAILWITVAAMIVAYWRLDGWAAFVTLPYLAWLSVAASLNFWIWRNNPGG